MGTTNYGNQTITLKFLAPADSKEINKRAVGTIQPGIYIGGYLTKVTDVLVTLSTLLCEIRDADYQVRIETTVAVGVTVSAATPYVVLRWAYTDAANNYMDILAVAVGSIQSNDLIIGKCVFVAGVLTGFDYTGRSAPNIFDVFLKVEPTSPLSMKVQVRAGRCTYGTSSLFILEQQSPVLTPPVSASRIDILYIDTDGLVKILQGTEGLSTPPAYANKVVLAEIGPIQTTTTEITAALIKDVRPWFVGVPTVAAFPSGGIIMWSGTIASIPSGWYLCNGANGTPDLRDRFIVGARQDSAGIAKTLVTGVLTKSGGAAVHTISGTTGSNNAGLVAWSATKGAGNPGDAAVGPHGHDGSSLVLSESLPPYYALAFIMKS